MKYDIVTIGDTMWDTFVFPSLIEMRKPIEGTAFDERLKSEKFMVLELGDKITITETYESMGGTACNVVAGLTKLKIKSALISAIGRDETGDRILTKFKKAKIDTSYLKSYLSRKTSFSIIISYKGDRTILVRQNFEPNDFNLPRNPDTKWIYIGPLGNDYRSLYSKITGLAVQKNIKIAINPGAIQIHDGLAAFGALLNIADIVFLNREEAQTLTGLTGVTTIKELALTIRKTGVAKVVITDGHNGGYISFENDFLKVGAYPGTCVESTGAGDAFATAFMAAYLKSESMLTCLKWGSINSASVVGKYGAQQGLLTLSAIEGKIKEYKWPAEDLRFS